MFEINGTMFVFNAELISAILGIVFVAGIVGVITWFFISKKSPWNRTTQHHQEFVLPTHNQQSFALQPKLNQESEYIDAILRQMRELSDTYMRKHYSNKYEITGNHSEYMHVWCKTAEEWLSIDLKAKAEYYIKQKAIQTPAWFHGLQERRAQRNADYVVYKQECDELYTQLSEPHLQQKQKQFNSMRRPEPSPYVLEVSAIWMNGMKEEKRVLQYTYEEVMAIVHDNS